MSLSELETAIANYVGDVLVNECGVAEPERILRYHGTLPHDCCTDDGFLVVSWERGYTTTSFPSASSGGKSPCPGRQVYTINVRYVVCWPAPEADSNGVQIIDNTWDGKASILADVADCIARALSRLECNPNRDDPFVEAVIAQTGTMVRYIETVPITPLGACAGVQWKLYASPRSAAVAS